MTSVVDTSVKYIHSGMAGAPVLTGSPGSMIGLLDAFLKDGFDIKTATSLSVVGGVATINYPGNHSAEKDTVIIVSGSSIGALNGEQKVIAAGAGQMKFATAVADGTATGTIQFKMAPLGWEKTFSGTNKGAYRSLDPQASGMFMRVDDTQNQVARVLGFETMSDIDTGVGQFPLLAQLGGGLTATLWPKSYQNGGTNPVSYVMFGDSRVVYIKVAALTGNSTDGSYTQYIGGSTHGFGDMRALRPSGDSYACVLAGIPSTTDWSNAVASGAFDGWDGNVHGFMPRHWSGVGTSWAVRCLPYVGTVNQSNVATGMSGLDPRLGVFPSRVDGGLRLSPRYVRGEAVINNSDLEPRAEVPGLFHIPQQLVFTVLGPMAKIEGSGVYVGRRFLLVPIGEFTTPSVGAPQAIGLTAVDVTGPWR